MTRTTEKYVRRNVNARDRDYERKSMYDILLLYQHLKLKAFSTTFIKSFTNIYNQYFKLRLQTRKLIAKFDPFFTPFFSKFYFK